MVTKNASDWDIAAVSTGVVSARNRITGETYQGNTDGLNVLISRGAKWTPTEIKERARLSALGVVTTEEDPLTGGIDFPVLMGVNNGVESAASNTGIIQTQLSSGGVAGIYTSGVVYISDTLIQSSGSHLVIGPNTTLKMTSGVNKTLVSNAALLTAFATVTVSWSAGNLATVTWAGHGLAVGDAVWLRGVAGTSQSQYSGVFRVLSVSGNNVTLLLRRRPTAAPAGVYEAKKADQHVRLTAHGTIDYNATQNASATGSNTISVVYGGVDGLKVDGANFADTKKYCICVGAVTSFEISNIYAPNAASDGVKVYGPAFDGEVAGIRGRYNDDLCSIQPQEAAPYAQYDYTGGGDCINIAVKDINGESSNAALFVLYSSANQYADNIEVDGVAGRSAAQHVKMYSGVGYSNCRVGRVRLANIQWQSESDRETIVFDASQTFKLLEIDGLLGSEVAGVAGATKSPIQFSSGGVDVLKIKGLRGFIGANIPFINFSGTFSCAIVDVGDYQVAGSSAGTLIKLGGTGTARSVSVKDGKATTLAKMVDVGSGVTSVPNIQIESGDINAASVVEANAACTINLRGGSRFTASTGVIRATGTGTAVAVTSSGNTLASGNWISQTGTPAVSVNASDITADVTTLARTPGATVYNTNTAAGTLAAAGRVLCDASGTSGSWKLMTDPTKSY
jgi:hypothetical protein